MQKPALHELEGKAQELAGTLRALGNDKRLMILCKLAEAGEMRVSALAEKIGLSQSALSQHLARMRADGLLGTRRDSQAIWYHIADPRIETLMDGLHRAYCVKTK